MPGGRNRNEKMQQTLCQRAAGDRSCNGQQHRFGQRLTHQPGSACPQGRANRKLTRPGGAARHQQAGNIGAGNQQHHTYRGQQNPCGRTGALHLAFAERANLQVDVVTKFCRN